MSILVITTGGTIGALAHDKIKNPDRIQKMPPVGVDLVREFLKNEFANFSTRFAAIEQRDSNLIDEAYRRNLMQIVEQAPERAILITHGTDTLLQSVDFAFQQQRLNSALRNKAILFTGSMVPLACGPESDGDMNVRFSLQFLNDLAVSAGVYIVLSDYTVPDRREGWAPRLYPYTPGRYEKYYDPEDGSRSRIRVVGA